FLLGSGADIHAINRLRQACSLIKGGRLASRLSGRQTWVLAISDVEGDDPAIIGSGPLSPVDSMPVAPEELPPALRKLRVTTAPLRPGDAAFRSIHYSIIASNDKALNAAALRAQAL